MKPFKSLSIFTLFMLIICSSASADGKTEKRNSCIILKRYVAEAKIKDPDSPFWITDEEKKCSGTAYAFVSAQDYCSGAGPYVAAEVEAQSSAAGESYTEYTLGCTGWTAGYNTDALTAVHSDFAMYENKKATYANNAFISSARISTSNTLFDESNNVVLLKDFQGYLAVNSNDVLNDYSTFVVTIKQYNEDETYSVLWQSRAFIYKGKLVVEGDLPQSAFQSSRMEYGVSYSITLNELAITLPDATINWENLAVELAVDGGNLGRGVPAEYSINFDSPAVREIDQSIQSPTYTFTVAQSIDQNQIFVSLSNSSPSLGDILLYSVDGKIVENLATNVTVDTQNQEFIFEIGNIPSGIYFVKFESDEFSLSRKIVVTR